MADTDEIRALVAPHLPGIKIESCIQFGEGYDYIVYDINYTILCRLCKESDLAERARYVARGGHLLHVVAEISPLPVPQPLAVVPDEGWLAYPKIAGRSLLEVADTVPAPARDAIAGELGTMLSALHATAPERLGDLVETDLQPLTQWRDEAEAFYRSTVDHVPAPHRPAVERFFAGPVPADPDGAVFSHNDLGAEHVIIDQTQWTVAGIIDWTDAALCDRAYDFGLILRDLGPRALDAALRHYGPHPDQGLRDRAEFYARCSIFEDIDYGIENGRDEYVHKSLRTLTWLFPA